MEISKMSQIARIYLINFCAVFVPSLLLLATFCSTVICTTTTTIHQQNTYQSNLNDASANDQLLLSSTTIGRQQIVDVPTIVSNTNTNNSSINGANQMLQESVANYYMNSQAQKFRVNVSNLCEKNWMRVTVRLNRPFYGLVHTKDKRRKPACLVEGNGDQTYTIDISYTQVQSEPNYCGVVSHHLSSPGAVGSSSKHHLTTSSNQSIGGHHLQQQQTLSVVLVVRLHKTIEFSDDRYFLLSCANRCSRPDCSSASGNLQEAANSTPARSSASQAFRGFVASESIVSPVLQTASGAANGPNSGSGNNKLVEPLAGWTTERCDIMLDLKFQWLVKLCWVLSILLLLMFSTSFYLCLALNGGRISKNRKLTPRDKMSLFSHKSRSSGGDGSNSSCTTTTTNTRPAGKHILYTQHQPEIGAWTGNSPAGDAITTTITNLEDINKIREDNSYLAKQHQQLLLANLLASKNTLGSDRGEQSRDTAGQNLVLGRSAELFNKGGSSGQQQRRQQLETAARVKRRQSIGSSITAVDPTMQVDLHHHHQQQQSQRFYQDSNSNKPLDTNQRAKSRSQTTIHYEQGQDPFKAVPFSYLNNGYLSDSATSQPRVYLAAGSSGPIDGVYGMTLPHKQHINNQPSIADQHPISSYPSGHNVSMNESISQQSLPPESAHISQTSMMNNSSNRLNMLNHQQRCSNFKPTFVPPPQMDGNVMNLANLNNQQSTSSQFDPQNSRQLIDLIQLKHRQQIAQANRTAAAMQPNELFAAEIQVQPSTKLSQQRTSVPAPNRSWR